MGVRTEKPRRGRRRGGIAVAVAAAAALSCALLPAAAPAATTCSFDDPTNTLNVGGDPNVGTHLQVSNSNLLVYHSRTTGSNLVDCSGLTATTTNTDTISVDHDSPDEQTRLSIANPERFAPGTVQEQSIGGTDCGDEIEINLDLGSGQDTLAVVDTDNGDDNFAINQDGIDWNPTGPVCDDLDIDLPFAGSVQILAGDGTNTLTPLSSDPLLKPLTYTGGTGKDEVTGGAGSDEIDGGAGKDVLRGGGGDDQLTGGAGRDKLFGGGGLDWLFAEDGQADRAIDCGPGARLGEFASFDRGKDPRPESC